MTFNYMLINNFNSDVRLNDSGYAECSPDGCGSSMTALALRRISSTHAARSGEDFSHGHRSHPLVSSPRRHRAWSRYLARPVAVRDRASWRSLGGTSSPVLSRATDHSRRPVSLRGKIRISAHPPDLSAAARTARDHADRYASGISAG